MTVHMIWAEAADRIVGADGGIPWRIPGEQAEFKRRTMGATVVMGRATWDSLPGRVRPLPGRRNIVLTRDRSWSAPGAEVAHDISDIDRSGEIWIIGGAAVYQEFLPYADHIVRTTVDLVVPGDVRAPELDARWVIERPGDWQVTNGGVRYVVHELGRADSSQFSGPSSLK